MRQYYRRADTSGESLQRELDRLIKRKTLITVDQLQTLANRIDSYLTNVNLVQKAFVALHEAITAIPS